MGEGKVFGSIKDNFQDEIEKEKERKRKKANASSKFYAVSWGAISWNCKVS